MDLDEKAWRVVLKGNGLLSGLTVQDDQSIARARRQAFLLNDEECDEPGIPSFEISDDSSITVVELKSKIQTAAAIYGLSWKDFEVALKKDVFIASLSGSFSKGSAIASTQAVLGGAIKEDLCVNYNFPRVVVYLRQEYLSLSEPCKKALRKIEETKDIAEVKQFGINFGHVFTPVVKLGGKLQCIRSASTISGSTMDEKSDHLRRAATGAFSASKMVGGSISREQQSLETQMAATSLQQNDLLLAWEARGGDTLLSSDPSLWAPTVQSSENWRVIQGDGSIGIVQLIGQIEGWKHIPKLFREIIETEGPLLSQKYNVDLSTPRARELALINAVTERKPSDDLELAKFLLDAGTNTECRDDNGDGTPLLHAMRSNNKGAAPLLIERAADVNARYARHGSRRGYTPALWAVRDVPLLRQIIERGANINAKSVDDGETALWRAAALACTEAVEILLDAGADPNARTTSGRTPLMEIARFGKDLDDEFQQKARIMQMLLSHGAEINAQDKEGRTALYEAANWVGLYAPAHKTLQLLVDNGANVNIREYVQEETALKSAVGKKHVEDVKVLVSAGADVNMANKLGTTPVDTAHLFCDTQGEILKILRANGGRHWSFNY